MLGGGECQQNCVINFIGDVRWQNETFALKKLKKLLCLTLNIDNQRFINIFVCVFVGLIQLTPPESPCMCASYNYVCAPNDFERKTSQVENSIDFKQNHSNRPVVHRSLHAPLNTDLRRKLPSISEHSRTVRVGAQIRFQCVGVVST